MMTKTNRLSIDSEYLGDPSRDELGGVIIEPCQEHQPREDQGEHDIEITHSADSRVEGRRPLVGEHEVGGEDQQQNDERGGLQPRRAVWLP